MKRRVIDADYLMEVIANGEKKFPNRYITWTLLRFMLEKPQLDVDPVHVAGGCYCRECKHWHESTGFCAKHSYFVDSDGLCCSPAESPNWTMFDADDYCSHGERDCVSEPCGIKEDQND